MSENVDRGKIKKAAKKVLIASRVSPNVFTSRPKTVDTKMNEFITVRIPGKISDLCAYGKATLFIDVHVRLFQDGTENDDKMTILIGIIQKLFPITEGAYYFDGSDTISLGIDDYGFNAETFIVDTLITI